MLSRNTLRVLWAGDYPGFNSNRLYTCYSQLRVEWLRSNMPYHPPGGDGSVVSILDSYLPRAFAFELARDCCRLQLGSKLIY